MNQHNLKPKLSPPYLLRGQDSNLRPLGYEPNELPTAPPRDIELKCKGKKIYYESKNILKFYHFSLLQVTFYPKFAHS